MALEFVKQFQQLEVYRRQGELSRGVFQVSKCFPIEERYALTDQMRRASRSVGASLAEAWGKRRYPKHFVSKLTDADSAQLETQHGLIEAQTCGYINCETSKRLSALCEEIGRMLQSMINKAEAFAGDSDTLREDPAPYWLTESTPDH